MAGGTLRGETLYPCYEDMSDREFLRWLQGRFSAINIAAIGINDVLTISRRDLAEIFGRLNHQLASKHTTYRGRES